LKIRLKNKANKRFFFEFAISFFLGLSDQVEMLAKVGKELDGMSMQRFFFSYSQITIERKINLV